MSVRPVISFLTSRLRRVLVPVAASALALGVLVAPPASAAVMFGHDVSWPQCSTAQGGYGLPMPPTSTQFVVVGLTKGLPFTTNPCLADQVRWTRDHAVPAQAYTMAGFPTSSQLSTYGSKGPWSGATRAGRLSNVGYAEGQYAAAALAKVAFRPAVVWIDVEPRPAQPWPTGSRLARQENRYVIEGVMRGLRAAGYAYGLYSYTSGWNDITGGWWLPGVPVWATAGRLDYPDEALDRCTQPSFSGGKVYLSQWYDDTRDYDRTCEPYAFTGLAVPPSSLSFSTGDFNGDWNNDVLARWTSTATLHLYAGTGTGTITSHVLVGSGWGSFSALETVGDFSGDGAQDVVARQRTTGYLFLYKGNGKGGWLLPATRIGSGWNAMNAIVGVGDVTGDGRVDILARVGSTGDAYVYPGTGRSGFFSRYKVGTAWNKYDVLVGPGDVTGDGAADLIARERSTGYLWLYPGRGTGTFAARVRIGTGWGAMTAVMSPGDLDGNRVADVVARDSAGRLWLYPRTPSVWLTRRLIGAGWNGINAIF